MPSMRVLSNHTSLEMASELEKMGLSPSEAHTLAAETVCLHVKIEGIPGGPILSLKRVAQSLDIRLIMSRPSSETPSVNFDLLLSGLPPQLDRLAAAMAKEGPDFNEISSNLRNLLKNIEKSRFTIACRTKTFQLGERTLIMGALNVTPDSFSDGGVFFDPQKAVARALEMAAEGADIIDIGGESTRPGARAVSPEEEMKRLIPIIEEVSGQTDTPISVDTQKSWVAQKALESGAQIINDISALRSDPKMANLVASQDVPIVLMHMLGTPETMQQNIHYDSLISEIVKYLQERIERACQAGVDLEKIIIDPGIGFGKTVDHNLAIIKRLDEFKILGRPILIGTSRKSFIGRILNADVTQREEGTMASVVASILNGAHIVRVHNVRDTVKAARIADAIKGVSLPEA